MGCDGDEHPQIVHIWNLNQWLHYAELKGLMYFASFDSVLYQRCHVK